MSMQDYYPPAINMQEDALMTSQMQQMETHSGNLPLAMAYVIMQPSISKVYGSWDALKRGTLFPELDKPWVGKRGAY